MEFRGPAYRMVKAALSVSMCACESGTPAQCCSIKWAVLQYQTLPHVYGCQYVIYCSDEAVVINLALLPICSADD